MEHEKLSEILDKIEMDMDIKTEYWPHEVYMPNMRETILDAYDKHITLLFNDSLPPSDDVLRDFGRDIWRAMSHEASELLEKTRH